MCRGIDMWKLIKARLIDEWKQAWKLASVQLSALGFILMALPEVFSTAWGYIPDDIKAQMPYANHVGMIMFGLVILARILKRKDRSDGEA